VLEGDGRSIVDRFKIRETPSFQVDMMFRNFSFLALAGSTVLFLTLFPLLNWVIFSGDDSHIMRVALDHGWLAPYLSPDAYRELSVANYTPLALTAYKALLTFFPLRPLVIVFLMLSLLAAISAVAATLVHKVTGSRFSAVICIVLIFSNLTVHTLASRFYTMHYLFGALFALIAIVLFLGHRQSIATIILACVLIFLSLLSKEVFIGLPILLALYAAHLRRYGAASAFALVLVVYWTIRTLMLEGGFSVGADNSYFLGFWNVSLSDWLRFSGWYLQTRYLIAMSCLVAIVANPVAFAKYFPIALVFFAPGMAVSHGIEDHEMHGDRIFFAFDLSLAIIASVCISRFKFVSMLPSREVLVVAALFAIAFGVHRNEIQNFRATTESSVDYKITRYLLDNNERLTGSLILVPFNFTQGDLMRVNALLGRHSYRLTQNCQELLQYDEDDQLAFDFRGDMISALEQERSCRPGNFEVSVDIAPRYRNGFLEWRLVSEAGTTPGVLFVDRAFAVPLPEFSQQLVKPSVGEQYQLFVTDGESWMFSEIETILQ
jgi:hypothetical protein